MIVPEYMPRHCGSCSGKGTFRRLRHQPILYIADELEGVVAD